MKSVRRALLVKKTSRLAYERKRAGYGSDELLARKLAEQGSDYQGLLQRHKQHESSVRETLRCLKNREIAVTTRDRDNITAGDAERSDIVIAAGGDGNFLTAASKVRSLDKLVVGINTDPERSEGHLCITPSPARSIEQIIDDIFKERLKYIRRQRISVLLGGKTLPVLALNEVFIGDSDPSQACYFELSCGDGPLEKIRSSGLLIYTGTGSTSWAYNARKLSSMQISQVLETAQRLGSVNVDESRIKEIIASVTKSYNERLVFSGSEVKIGYIIREPIRRGSFDGFIENPARICERLKVKSRSFDNQLIVDGQHHYKFPNGREAEFYINPSDSLLTMHDHKLTVDSR